MMESKPTGSQNKLTEYSAALNDDVGANHITSKGKLDVKGLQSCFTVAIAASAVSRTLGIW